MLRPKNDIVEIFGYASDDLTKDVRVLWNLGACPFINKACSKTNSDQTIVYGTCSVTTAFGDCIICPNRIYERNYAALRKVAVDAFGDGINFLMYEDFIAKRGSAGQCIVALGQNSGKEVKLGNKLSMDWVLVNINDGVMKGYVGIEVQSIDITNNYRDNWYAYKNLKEGVNFIPRSDHGMNWANVHKRLIPQLIRKGIIYSRSKFAVDGLYFILPDIVYRKFEDVIGNDIPTVSGRCSSYMTVHTYSLSSAVKHGEQRKIVLNREIKFDLEEFASRFISGINLPPAEDLDNAIRNILAIA